MVAAGPGGGPRRQRLCHRHKGSLEKKVSTSFSFSFGATAGFCWEKILFLFFQKGKIQNCFLKTNLIMIHQDFFPIHVCTLYNSMTERKVQFSCSLRFALLDWFEFARLDPRFFILGQSTKANLLDQCVFLSLLS